jgi:ATP-dependent Lon protease
MEQGIKKKVEQQLGKNNKKNILKNNIKKIKRKTKIKQINNIKKKVIICFQVLWKKITETDLLTLIVEFVQFKYYYIDK